MGQETTSRNRKLATLLHIICWAVMFIQSLLLAPEDEDMFEWNSIIHRLTFPTAMFIIFYLDYLWLVPKYYLNKDYRSFIILNGMYVLFISFGIHEIEELCAENRPEVHVPHWQIILGFFIRHVVTLVSTASLATMIRLSMRWHNIQETKQEIAKEKTEAQLQTLRSQINPHFLLNTLNNIYALIAFDQEKAQHAVMSLSHMLRQMLYGNTDNAINIKDEVRFIENYVKLMKIRLPQNVEVNMTTEIPQNSDQIMVAPFISISLVENAFKHGVSPTEHSFININIAATTQNITFDISNSNFPKSDKDRSGHGIGLKLVESRLKLYYEGKYTWEKTIDNNIYKSKIIIYDTELRDNR